MKPKLASRARPGAIPAEPGRPDHDNSAAVNAFFAALHHPLKPTLLEIRSVILAAAPAITEGIKWNTASFYREGWFATLTIRAKPGAQVVLHHGAKIRNDRALDEPMEDPAGLLRWLAKDRSLITFVDAQHFRARRAAFEGVIQAWVKRQQALAQTA